VALRILKKQGHDVDLVTTGTEAVATAARQRLDVILMDGQMPGMGGLEATALIRVSCPPRTALA